MHLYIYIFFWETWLQPWFSYQIASKDISIFDKLITFLYLCYNASVYLGRENIQLFFGFFLYSYKRDLIPILS